MPRYVKPKKTSTPAPPPELEAVEESNAVQIILNDFDVWPEEATISEVSGPTEVTLVDEPLQTTTSFVPHQDIEFVVGVPPVEIVTDVEVTVEPEQPVTEEPPKKLTPVCSCTFYKGQNFSCKVHEYQPMCPTCRCVGTGREDPNQDIKFQKKLICNICGKYYLVALADGKVVKWE